MLIYWAAITVGPLLLGASLTITSYVLTASREVVNGLPGGLRVLLDTLEYGLVAAAMAATYRYVPNTQVKWTHAWVGGLFAAAGIEVAKKLLAIYLGLVPTYSVVYGAFATVPILLVWIYLAWVMVLLGAVTAAYLPSLLSGVQRRFLANGWQFQLALEVLQQLQQARVQAEKGLSLSELSAHLRVDPLYLEPVIDNLIALDWVGEISEPESRRGARHVLLADPQSTLLAPLAQRLLLRREPGTQAVWDKGGLSALRLSDVL
jgi:membrane protein